MGEQQSDNDSLAFDGNGNPEMEHHRTVTTHTIFLALLLLVGWFPCIGSAENAAQPLGEPVLEPPTLHCLGVYWLIGSDDNQNATIGVEYRPVQGQTWNPGPPLFRVEKDAHVPDGRESKLVLPADAWLFAGSIVMLAPDTAYELKLRLADPDGGNAERRLTAQTIAEPVVPADASQYHVVPGDGGGTGTLGDPYRGLAAAQANAQAGDLFLLHSGIYEGVFTVERSGEPGRPIVWRGAGDGDAIIDAQGQAAERPGRVVSASGIHDVWFENLTLRNAAYGLVAHNSSRLVIRRCHIYSVDYGITLTRNDDDATNGFFISDNILEGPSTWPRTKGIENARGIQVTGAGHVVCYNRIRGFADGIDTFPSQRCAAIDFHNNEISEMTDDGIEMDFSERNTRCFLNRLTNVFQGISVQPIYGGPIYIFRNALYNVVMEPLKMHNSPSGVLMFHNTSVKKGMPLVLWTGVPVRHCIYRNNLFLGTQANYAYESTAPMIDCDFDYDGFGGEWSQFLKWNNVRYRSIEDARERAPVYQHAVFVEPETAFATGLLPPDDDTVSFKPSVNDLRLGADSGALDRGAILPGFNDGYQGDAPDLGAYEFGTPLPHYGPRPEKQDALMPMSD